MRHGGRHGGRPWAASVTMSTVTHPGDGRGRELRGSGVTPREAEVLAALTERLTNAQIAARLCISVRTVESHVSSLLVKLGATGRGSLAELGREVGSGWVAELPLPPPLSALVDGAPFLGRDNELDRLRGCWQAATAGRRRFALVSGEPGAGKSRLAAELAADVLSEGAIVLHGRCDDALGVPYDAFTDALSAYVRAVPVGVFSAHTGVLGPELTALLPWLPSVVDGLGTPTPQGTATSRHLLFESVGALLDGASAVAPVLLVLDDLQWATEPTFLMLRHVVRSTVPARLLIVGTYRCRPERGVLSRALVDLRRDALPLEIALPQAHHDAPNEPAPTLTAGERTPFVGRAAERSVLAAAIRKARSGTGGLVLIGGEPGIGKTRLAEEAAAEATRAGMAVFSGHHYEMAGASPYIAFVEVLEAALAAAADAEAFRAVLLADAAPEIARLMPRLRRLLPGLAPPLRLPPNQERQYLFTCLADVLGRLARRQPTLLILDDLQWADESSLRFLSHVAPALTDLPLLVVATYRDVDVGRPLARTFSDLHRRRLAARLHLGAMATDETAQIVAFLAGADPPPDLVAAVATITEGNVFFLEEVLRDLLARDRLLDEHGRFRADLDLATLEVPEGVRLVTTRRLERLSSDGQRLLAAAAVAGRVFTFPLLGKLTDLDAEAILDVIDEAERAVLIREGPGPEQFLFAHELVRQTLLAGLSGPRRRRAHLRAAEAMISIRGNDPEGHAAEIAHHLVEAGAEDTNPARRFHYCLRAGLRGVETADFAGGLGHLERAVALLDVAGGAQRVELFATLARARRGSGDPERAALAWERMGHESAALGDLVSVARAGAEAWSDVFYSGHFTEAHAVLARALTGLGDSLPAERARLLSRLGVSLTLAGDPVAGDDHYTAARKLADNVDDPQLTAILDADRTQACFATMRTAEGTTIGLRGAQSLRAAGEAWDTLEVLWPVAANLVWLGRFSESRAVLDEIIPVARRLGHAVALNIEHKIRGPARFFESGDLKALFDSAQADVAAGDTYLRGTWNFVSYAWQGLSLLLQGHQEEAEPYFRLGAETARGAFGGWARAAWFSYLASVGRRAEAIAVFEGHRADLPAGGQPATTGEWALLFAFTEGLFLLGEREHPAAWHPLIVEAISETGTIITAFATGRLLERVAGIAATAGGDHDVAETHFRAALRQADDLPCQFERLETRRFYAQMLSERAGPSDLDRARRLLTEAVEGYTRFGMPSHSQLAQDSRAALGQH